MSDKEIDIHIRKPVVYTKGIVSGHDRALLCINGFEGTAVGILRFVNGLEIENVALAGVEADGLSWFPRRLNDSKKTLEPHLSCAIKSLENATNELRLLGFSTKNIYFLGFSQGACLALEYVIRTGGGWGGLFVLAGCLIGSERETESIKTDLRGLPIFIGYGEEDESIPSWKVLQTVDVLGLCGADVNFQLYRNTGHKINHQEAEYLKSFFTTQKNS